MGYFSALCTGIALSQTLDAFALNKSTEWKVLWTVLLVINAVAMAMNIWLGQ